MRKKIVFLTGTRADYGKLKSLMRKVEDSPHFDLHVFVTGMHMLKQYGSTFKEIEKDGYSTIYKYINQRKNTPMDTALTETIVGLSNYVSEAEPDLIVIHGDRLEALAGAIVGAFNNIKVAHIEGGEVSGTIDESIRHAITKFAHFHLVANEEAKERIMQLGEEEEAVYIIGSPDIDIMYSENLPTMADLKDRYNIDFEEFGILMYHPVTTESRKTLKQNIKNVVDAVIESDRNYVVIFPNNDFGSETILEEMERLKNNPKFKVFPSIRFEYFLSLLKHADFMMGNSSAGVRETSVYGTPSINIGDRQQGRVDPSNGLVLNASNDKETILNQLEEIKDIECEPTSLFGKGNSDELFLEILERDTIWDGDFQKRFVDLINRMDNYV